METEVVVTVSVKKKEIEKIEEEGRKTIINRRIPLNVKLHKACGLSSKY